MADAGYDVPPKFSGIAFVNWAPAPPTAAEEATAYLCNLLQKMALAESSHSPWGPMVHNRLGSEVTKTLFRFFRAGWTLPGKLCPTAPREIEMKLDFTRNPILVAFFPCPVLLPLLSSENPHWMLQVHDNSCVHPKIVSVHQTWDRPSFQKDTMLIAHQIPARLILKNNDHILGIFSACSILHNTLYMLSLLFTPRVFYSRGNWA